MLIRRFIRQCLISSSLQTQKSPHPLRNEGLGRNGNSRFASRSTSRASLPSLEKALLGCNRLEPQPSVPHHHSVAAQKMLRNGRQPGRGQTQQGNRNRTGQQIYGAGTSEPTGVYGTGEQSHTVGAHQRAGTVADAFGNHHIFAKIKPKSEFQQPKTAIWAKMWI